MYSNQIRFDSSQHGRDAVVPEARLHWLPISTQVRLTQPFKVSSNKLQLQDNLFDVNDSSIFELEMLPSLPYEKDTNTLFDITIERNLD